MVDESEMRQSKLREARGYLMEVVSRPWVVK